MAELVKFKIGDVVNRAKIILLHSRKQTCIICGEKRWGVLIRPTSPKKLKDTCICLECITQIGLGMNIQMADNNQFGFFNEGEILKAFKIRENLRCKTGKYYNTQVKQEKDCKCPYCDKVFASKGLGPHIRFKHPETLTEGVPVPEPPVEPKVEENTVEPKQESTDGS